MASLGDNPIWNDVQSGASTASNDIMGPSYSYADNIAGPSSLGVGSDGSIGQVFTNVEAIMDYVGYMVSGPALGNAYFVNTGGTCSAPDASTQSRYSYINNIANGANDLSPSMKASLGGIASDFDGLIPGMIGDIEGLNPLNLFTALTTDSTPACDCYTCETSNGPESYFMTPALSPDYDPAYCVKADPSVCKASAPSKKGGGKKKEKFSNYTDSTMIPTILAVIGFIALQVF
jgi:hypothetical protein